MSWFRPNAKLLWKRIPSNVKSENSELSAIWQIGIKLWNRELSQIYSLLKDYEWPNHLKNVIKCIGGLTQFLMTLKNFNESIN
jgi:COP9 signalosome complex subunit 8